MYKEPKGCNNKKDLRSSGCNKNKKGDVQKLNK